MHKITLYNEILFTSVKNYSFHIVFVKSVRYHYSDYALNTIGYLLYTVVYYGKFSIYIRNIGAEVINIHTTI